MRTLVTLITLFLALTGFAAPDANEILKKVDHNLSSKNRVMESTIIIHGNRNSRTMTSRSYAVGTEKAFTEYLSPARDAGTKMLKLDDQLWIYSPGTDRTRPTLRSIAALSGMRMSPGPTSVSMSTLVAESTAPRQRLR